MQKHRQKNNATLLAGQDFSPPYDTLFGVFHGDWYDAADIYKAWATQQWWCAKKLWDRDIADWLRTGVGGVFQMSNYHIPEITPNHSMGQIAETVNELSRQSGVPLLGLVFNWERGGAWTGPKGFFPPRNGTRAFKEAMQALREAGNVGFVYITGYTWYAGMQYNPPWDSWSLYEAEGQPLALKQPDGSVNVMHWYPGWDIVRLCAAPEASAQMQVDLFLKCLDLGCAVVQIDNLPCGGSDACYDLTHDHPPGYGSWWSEAVGRMLAETRRRGKEKNPNCAMSTEGVCENFIPWLDLFDQRAPNMEYFGHYHRGLPAGGETIPLFNYIYGEYIGAYCAAYPECNRPEVLYWTRCLGKALAQGVLPTGGRYFPDPREHNPITIGFYRKIVRAAGEECYPYLMFGEMLRRPEIDVPIVTAHYCKFNYVPERGEHRMDPQQLHQVTDASVQHAAFRGRDGSVAYILVNVSEDAVNFEVELSDHGMGARRYTIDRIVDGDRTVLRRAASLPRTESVEMGPLSITVLIVRRAGSRKVAPGGHQH